MEFESDAGFNISVILDSIGILKRRKCYLHSCNLKEFVIVSGQQQKTFNYFPNSSWRTCAVPIHCHGIISNDVPRFYSPQRKIQNRTPDFRFLLKKSGNVLKKSLGMTLRSCKVVCHEWKKY